MAVSVGCTISARSASRTLEPSLSNSLCATLRSVAHKLFDKLGSCVRLALRAEMVQPTETAMTAYRTLIGHMGSATFKADGGSEFVYQMNRPRESRVLPGLLINRL